MICGPVTSKVRNEPMIMRTNLHAVPLRITGPLCGESADSPHKGPVMYYTDIFLVVLLTNQQQTNRLANEIRSITTQVKSLYCITVTHCSWWKRNYITKLGHHNLDNVLVNIIHQTIYPNSGNHLQELEKLQNEPLSILWIPLSMSFIICCIHATLGLYEVWVYLKTDIFQTRILFHFKGWIQYEYSGIMQRGIAVSCFDLSK